MFDFSFATYLQLVPLASTTALPFSFTHFGPGYTTASNGRLIKEGSSKGPKSPKSTRSGKAAATSETESKRITKSPKLTRKGAAAVAHETSFNNEDYNIRSPERIKLLTKIKGVIDNAPISPALWACCQLADMNRLQVIANSDEDMILAFQDSLAFIALQCELLDQINRKHTHC